MPASDYLIGANDEHGLNPPTIGKRSPILPYVNRSFYENEFNVIAKQFFIAACLRQGFRVYDVKPETQDISVSTRVTRINRQNLTLLVTFAYNAFGSGNNFNSAVGFGTYYSTSNARREQSRVLSEDVYEAIEEISPLRGRGVSTLDVGVLSNVNCPSTLIEAGFMTNFEEAKIMHDVDYIIIVAEGACKGVCDNLSVPYIPRNELNRYPTLRRGSVGNFVRLAQTMLNLYGGNLSVDGNFGLQTENAVKAFQAFNGLEADGIVGPNTWSKLLMLNPSADTLQSGSTGSSVWYLQKKLLSKLYPIGTIDGVFGPNTERAVKEFQTEMGINPDGIVGATTWAALRPIGYGRPRLY